MTPKKILVIEDEEIIRRLCSRLLTGGGYHITVTGLLREGLARISREHFDLLITDLRLPDGHGLEAVSAFQKERPSAQVIVITGSPSWQDEENLPAFDNPRTKLIQKPFDVDVFESAVGKAIREAK